MTIKKFLHRYLLSILFYGIIAIAILVALNSVLKSCTQQNDWEVHRTAIEIPIGWGDTLNQIAVKYKPSFMTIDEYACYLRELNGMTDSMLYAGQLFKVYIYDERGVE